MLDSIGSPADLRHLPEHKLPALVEELRLYLTEVVSKNGGHFAASLGVVELTVALHYLYDTPEDRLVWDVGHQAYIHKILTGRKDRLASIRKRGGLAPFPKREESGYDAFGVGHSSTSIGAALGMAIAARQTGCKRAAIAVIGDGGMTAGMAFEALNHAGTLHDDLLVIYNDNNMSISPNVGALSKKFTRVFSSRMYSALREEGKKALSQSHFIRGMVQRLEERTKGTLLGSSVLFEEFDFNYTGPIDGHDLESLLRVLKNIRELSGPQLLHIVTVKGKGYTLAEEDPVKYHGVTPFDPQKGIEPSGRTDVLTYSKVFGQWLCDMAAKDQRLVGITPAMCEGSGMVRFSKEYPDRYFDVAIAEQHSVTLAAGMACDGLKPVVAIYSTFLQRAYDQLVHDVVLQGLPVLFAIDRAGLVGADGPTHNGSYDFSFMRCLPKIVIMAPSDENECRQMLYTGFQLDGPAAVRYPRGGGMGVPPEAQMQALPLGKAEIRRQGKDVAILSFGALLDMALEVGEELDATVVNMRFVKPLDRDAIMQMADSHSLLVTLEENVVAGGAGSGVGEVLMELGRVCRIVHYGLPDELIQHGSRDDMLDEAGLRKQPFLEFIQRHLGKIG
ncbi:MAG: 1-deoxy-D-xylulose-5-phosphate synthase [Candidatus Eutrophobiaceae bacterium]